MFALSYYKLEHTEIRVPNFADRFFKRYYLHNFTLNVLKYPYCFQTRIIHIQSYILLHRTGQKPLDAHLSPCET